MKPIHAYTEVSGAPYPGYISLNEMHTDSDPDKNVLTVRQQGHLGMKQASIVLSRDQLMTLAGDILEHLQKKADQA